MRKVADQVVFLHKGRVIYFGPVDGLEASDDPDIREFLDMDRLNFSGTSLRADD
jgi:ABC-type transporter Mla maintaining outer membrane lipid asymmetry ATPase subunit MlaF